MATVSSKVRKVQNPKYVKKGILDIHSINVMVWYWYGIPLMVLT